MCSGEQHQESWKNVETDSSNLFNDSFSIFFHFSHFFDRFDLHLIHLRDSSYSMQVVVSCWACDDDERERTRRRKRSKISSEFITFNFSQCNKIVPWFSEKNFNFFYDASLNSFHFMLENDVKRIVLCFLWCLSRTCREVSFFFSKILFYCHSTTLSLKVLLFGCDINYNENWLRNDECYKNNQADKRSLILISSIVNYIFQYLF